MPARASAKRKRCQVVFNARTLSLGPSRNSAQGRCSFAVSPPSMPMGRLDETRLHELQKSCSLLRTGTYPCSVSERLRIASDASEITAKTRREARLNPSETDLPRLCEACAMPGGFNTRNARMRTANIQLGTARERSDRTRNGQLRLCRSTSRRSLARCSCCKP